MNGWARQNLPPVHDEAWIKLTCHGVVTPRGLMTTAIDKPIMIGHIQINPYAPYPRFNDLRDSHSAFFKGLTKACTERRRAQVILTGFSGSWLDWGTDWAHSALDIGETFIAAANVGACRAVGGPCLSNAQCCGSSTFVATCNIAANTCESTAVPSDTGGSTNPN